MLRTTQSLKNALADCVLELVLKPVHECSGKLSHKSTHKRRGFESECVGGKVKQA